MSRKSKGIGGEREVVHMFWRTGNWACHRIAGSGSSRYPSPDLIASNILRKLAIECKTTKSRSVYIPRKEIEALREFCRMFGAESWIGIRFDKEGWFFMTPDDLKDTEKNYTASLDSARQKGFLFEEMINAMPADKLK